MGVIRLVHASAIRRGARGSSRRVLRVVGSAPRQGSSRRTAPCPMGTQISADQLQDHRWSFRV